MKWLFLIDVSSAASSAFKSYHHKVQDPTLAVVDMAPAIFIWEFMTFVWVVMEVTLELTAYVRFFCFLSCTSCLARILHASRFPLFAIFFISASWRCGEVRKGLRTETMSVGMCKEEQNSNTEQHLFPITNTTSMLKHKKWHTEMWLNQDGWRVLDIHHLAEKLLRLTNYML